MTTCAIMNGGGTCAIQQNSCPNRRLAGVGLIRTHVSLNPLQGGERTTNSFGYDLGGGINGFFSPGVGIRGDLRRLQTFGDVAILRVGPVNLVPSEKLSFWRASLGLTFKF